MAKTVYVGMSGGVDSSVTAALLKEQGYTVVGVYMKNWSQDLPGMVCPWKEDYQDAKRVAVQLGIDFKMYDFQKEYRQKVVDYMIAEYSAGRTPNPDIMCNQEVKFKLFLEAALSDGAELIATGHYARIANARGRAELLTAKDGNKDQTYFLYRVTEDALSKSLFPVGGYTKPEIRGLAKKFGLATAAKKDSQGICFVGKVGIKEFLEQFVTAEPGSIIDQDGTEIGMHDGAIFYTIGQRHGLHVGGGLPYYVVGKDMGKNQVFVTSNLDDGRLWHDSVTIGAPHWINGEPIIENSQPGAPSHKLPATGLRVRTRYRAPLIDVTGLQKLDDGTWHIDLKDEIRALTPGQSAVLYDGERVAGGGIVI
jgi:tRNA-specific 2-thiouridylase